LQEGGGGGGDGVFGFVVEGGRLAGVEDDGGYGVFAQREVKSEADLGSASPFSSSKTRHPSRARKCCAELRLTVGPGALP